MAQTPQAGMAEDLGDHGRVRAAAKHMRGAGAPERMRVNSLEFGLLSRDVDDVADRVMSHAFPAAVQPEGIRWRRELREKPGPPLLEIEPQILDGVLAQGNETLLPAFALHLDRGAVKVNVVDGEAGGLAPSHAGGVKNFKQGAVAETALLGKIGYGKQALDFPLAENGSECKRWLLDFQAFGGIVEYLVRLLQVAEQELRASQGGLDFVGAVVVFDQAELERFEGLAVNVGKALDAFRLQEQEQPSQTVPPLLDGLRTLLLCLQRGKERLGCFLECLIGCFTPAELDTARFIDVRHTATTLLQ